MWEIQVPPTLLVRHAQRAASILWPMKAAAAPTIMKTSQPGRREREREVFFQLKGTTQRLRTSHLLTFSLAGLGPLATSTEIKETETKSSLAERPNPQRKLKGPVTEEGGNSKQSEP